MEDEDLTLKKFKLMGMYGCVRVAPFMEFDDGTKGSVLLLRYNADDSLVVLVNSPERTDEYTHGKNNTLYPSEVDQFYAYRQACIEKYDGHYCMSKERYDEFGIVVLTDVFLSAVIADFICSNLNHQNNDPRHITNWNTSRTSNMLSNALHKCTISEIEDELDEFMSEDSTWMRSILLETMDLFHAKEVFLKNIKLDWKTVRNKYAEWLWNDSFKLKLCFAERVLRAHRDGSVIDWRRMLEETMRDREKLLEAFCYSRYSIQEIIGMYALSKYYSTDKPDAMDIRYASVKPDERVRIFSEYFDRFSDEMLQELEEEDDPLRTSLPSRDEANDRARQRMAELRGRQPEGLTEEQQETYAKYEQAFCDKWKVGEKKEEEETTSAPTINTTGPVYNGPVYNIGTQNVYNPPKPQRPAAEPTKKAIQENTFEPDYMTFTKVRTCDYNIVALYQELLRQNWIEDGNPDNFIALFSGKISEQTIIWSGKVGKDNLYALFKMMVDNKFISVPDGHSLQRIVESHFVNTEGDNITGIDSGKPSKSALAVIEQLRLLLAARQNFDE